MVTLGSKHKRYRHDAPTPALLQQHSLRIGPVVSTPATLSFKTLRLSEQIYHLRRKSELFYKPVPATQNSPERRNLSYLDARLQFINCRFGHNP